MQGLRGFYYRLNFKYNFTVALKFSRMLIQFIQAMKKWRYLLVDFKNAVYPKHH